MFQVRIYGRGGQSVLTTAEILALAALKEGKYATTFPDFIKETKGMPVMASCRISQSPFTETGHVLYPDAIIIQDTSLMHQANPLFGLMPSGYLLINSEQTLGELGIDYMVKGLRADHTCILPATDIAARCIGRPVPNSALIGAFAALTGLIRLTSLQAAILDKFCGSIGEMNIFAAQAAHQFVLEHLKARAA